MRAQPIVKVVTKSEDLAHEISARSCKIVVEEGLFFGNRIAPSLRNLLGERRAIRAAITDANVRRLYHSEIKGALKEFGSTKIIAVSPGETSKTLEHCSNILSQLFRAGLGKDAALILVGGGVVGDLGGLVASLYKRGLAYIQVPTTLLAQVDSSIGGKTGVNTQWGKNQVGTFYQPAGVLIDPRFLRTLPPSELLNGIGEMVKYGVVSSKEIFTALERCVDFSVDEVRGLIKPCCRIKAGLVSEDERDQGVRTILNYGHTVAHALESSSHYRLGHGVSVLIGMLSEGWIAQEMGIFEPSDFERQQTLIKRILNLTKKNSFRIKENQVIEFAFGDKKNFGGKLMMALPERIGTMHGSNDGSYKIEVSSRLLRQSLVHVRSILSPTE